MEIKKIVLYAIGFVISGCSSLAIKENITGNYYLVAADDGEDCSLSYHEEEDDTNYWDLISATVFAAGANEKYIIAKQHPRNFISPPDKNITNYYILPLKKGMDWSTKNGLIGPLTKMEFFKKRKELGIPNGLTFTKVIKDLE